MNIMDFCISLIIYHCMSWFDSQSTNIDFFNTLKTIVGLILSYVKLNHIKLLCLKVKNLNSVLAISYDPV